MKGDLPGIDARYIQEISRIPILWVAERLNMHVMRRNRMKCVSPNHDDTHPSMSINIRTNSWRCFACGAHGSVINFVMEACNLDFLPACYWLAESFNIQLPDRGNTNRYRNATPSLAKKISNSKVSGELQKEVDHEILQWIVDNGKLSETAYKFLYEERLIDSSVVDKCHLFSINSEEKFIRSLGQTFGFDRCLKSGILYRDSVGRYHSHFIFPALVFPFYDYCGNIVNLQSRTFNPTDKTKRFRFIKDYPLIPFNLSSLRYIDKDECIYISEGVTDCLAMLSEGKTAIAIPGASNYRKEFAEYLDGHIILMYPDKDKAGERLFDAIADSLRSTLYRRELPVGFKDYADFHIANYKAK